jgi:hypothetical protein
VEEKAIGFIPYFGDELMGRGRDGDEIEDFIEEEQITTSKPRRRSNSNSNMANGNGISGAVKSKFEVNDIDEEAVDES